MPKDPCSCLELAKTRPGLDHEDPRTSFPSTHSAKGSLPGRREPICLCIICFPLGVFKSKGFWDLTVSVTIWDSDDRQWEDQDGNRGWETTVGEGSSASWEPMSVIPVFQKLRQEG